MEINDRPVNVLRRLGGWNSIFRRDGRSHGSFTSFDILECNGTDRQRDHCILIECADFLYFTIRIRTGGRQQFSHDVHSG